MLNMLLDLKNVEKSENMHWISNNVNKFEKLHFFKKYSWISKIVHAFQKNAPKFEKMINLWKFFTI